MTGRTVAAFDFDGTLARGDSLLPFLAHVAGRRQVGRALAVQWPRIAAAMAGLGDRDAAKVALVGRLLTGMPAAAVGEAGKKFAVRLERRLRPDMVERLQWHQAEGHDTVIVSASLAVYLNPLGRRLAVDEVLATGLEVDDEGRLTGRLAGANVRGAEKAARLGAHLAAAGEPCELWAYGDSVGDRELLAMADHPLRVGPRRLAQRWPRPDAKPYDRRA